MIDNPVGLIVGLVMLAGFVIWGIFVFRSRTTERSTEASSHYESGIGSQGGGPLSGSD